MQTILYLIASRGTSYIGVRGLSDDEFEYIGKLKNRLNTRYEWAYALTTIIETLYGLKTDKRVVLDPFSIINHTAQWWRENAKPGYEHCKYYSDVGSYYKNCTLEFMNKTKTTMKLVNGNDSGIFIKDYKRINIANMKELNDTLDEYKVIYSSGCERECGSVHTLNYYANSINCDYLHLVISSLTVLSSNSKLYLELIDSKGRESHYLGIMYILVADNYTSELVNNAHVFDETYVVEIDELPDKSKKQIKTFKALTGVFCSFFIVSVACLIVVLYLYDKNKKSTSHEQFPPSETV